MPLSDRIKPISYLKANAGEIAKNLAERQEPMIMLIADGRRDFQTLLQLRFLV